MTPAKPKRVQKARRKSSGHPLMAGREKGVWHPDLVGKVKGYPRTLEKFQNRVDLMRQQIKLYNAEGISTRRGVPDGFAGRKADLTKFRHVAAVKAKRIVTKMAESENITDPRAISAMTQAVEIFELRDGANVPIYKAAERIAAIRTVLEWTAAKPAAKSDISLTKAEDWLKALAK